MKSEITWWDLIRLIVLTFVYAAVTLLVVEVRP